MSDRPSYLIDVELKFKDPKFNKVVNVNGDNSTDQKIRDYYVGEKFDQGAYPKEDMQECIDVVITR